MARVFRFVIPAVLIAPVVALAVLLLISPVADRPHYHGSGMGPPERIGWPWEFAELASGWDDSPPRNWWLLTADLVILILAIVVLLCLILRWQKNRFRFRFSVLTLLASISCAAVPIGWLTSEYWEWKHEQELLQSLQNRVFGDWDYCGPEWLRRLWNANDLTMFHRTTSASGFIDEDLASKLVELTQLAHLELGGVSDRELVDIARCRHVVSADLSGTMTDVGMKSFADWQSIESLSLDAPALSDAGVAALAKCQQIESLSLNAPGLSDKSILSINQMRSLQNLDLSSSNKLSDRAMRELIKSPNLKSVGFPDVKDLTETTFNLLVERFGGPLHFFHHPVDSFAAIEGLRDSDAQALREPRIYGRHVRGTTSTLRGHSGRSGRLVLRPAPNH